MFQVKIKVGASEERTSTYSNDELSKALDDAMETAKSLIRYSDFTIGIFKVQNEYCSPERVLEIVANGIVI
jgi:hypothetical protein